MNYRFVRGVRFALDDVEMTIERRNPDGTLQVENLRSGQSVALSRDALCCAIGQRRLRFIPQSRNLTRAKRADLIDAKIDREIESLDDAKREALKRRLAYVKAVEAHEGGLSKAAIDPVIDALAKARGEPAAPRRERVRGVAYRPSFQQVLRWRAKYVNSLEDPRTQIDGRHRSGIARAPAADRRRVAEKTLELAREAVAEKYLQRPGFSRLATFQHLELLVEKHNRKHPEDQLAVSRYIIDRVIAETPAALVVERREGKHMARNRFRGVTGGRRVVAAPLERSEMDHTPTDLMVVDDRTRLPLGRLTASVMIDAHSTNINGYYLGFEPPSDHAVLACMKQAFLPKTWVQAIEPACRNAWEVHGIPDALGLDNDASHHSRAVEDVALRLNFDLDFRRVKTPSDGGRIERWFRTLNTRLLHRATGTTFSNIFLRGDYDPMRNAIATFDEVHRAFLRFIVDDYQQTVNKTRHDTPANLWARGFADGDEPRLADADMLDIIMGKTETRTLSHNGVENFGLIYNSRALTDLRRDRANPKTGRMRVKVKMDCGDVDYVHVEDPRSREWIRVPSLKPEYTKGLTLYQHRVFSQYQKEQANDRARYVTVLEAREEILEKLNGDHARKGAKRTRRREARLSGAGSDKAVAQARRKMEESVSITDVSAPAAAMLGLDEAAAAPRRSVDGARGKPPAGRQEGAASRAAARGGPARSPPRRRDGDDVPTFDAI